MSDICTLPLYDIWNKEIITQNNFKILILTSDLKIIKREDSSLLRDYRPVSVLAVVSKICEKLCRSRIHRQAFISSLMWI